MALNPAMIGRKDLSFLVLFSGSKGSEQDPEVHPIQKAAAMFAEAVESRTKGEIRVTVHPVNTLYSQLETLEKTTRGIVDMCVATQGALDKYVKEFALVMMPFVYDGYNHAYKVLDGPFKEWIAPLLQQKKLMFLANWEWGFRNITNNLRPVNSPEDVKALKLRVPPGEKDLRAAMEACGAVVTEIDLPSLYAALKNGVVDGEENPLTVIYHFKLYEVQTYLALTRHVYNCMVHVMSLKTWEKLTPDQQHIVAEESQKAGKSFRKAVQQEEYDLLGKLKEKGMVVTTPNMTEFRAAMNLAYKQIAQDVGEENIKKFLKMVDTNR
jgi:tripartite ATP-independent transporter DctP family solute receptor